MPSPRHDSVLNTGLSSAIQRKQQARVDRQKQLRDGTRSELTPGAEILLDWLNKDLKDVDSMSKKILGIKFDELRAMVPLAVRMNVDDKDLLLAQVLAQAMHIEWLKSAKNRVKATLRKASVADKKAEAEENAKLPQAWQDAEKDMKNAA